MDMIPGNVIGISGLGLMGGSLASAIKKYIPRATVIGYDNNSQSAERAREFSYIDSIENTFDELANSVDILYLTAPISSVLKQIKDLHSCTRNLIVTDMCSVKRPVMQAAKTFAGNITFIGGHPMAGSQKSGVEYADSDLFRNAVYVLCPPITGDIPIDLSAIISAVGARPVILPPDIHDRAVSQVSHVPQLLAVALLNELAQKSDDESAPFKLAAGGFRDLTRIGESTFSLWKDILEENKDNVISDLGRLIVRLNAYKDALQNYDMQKIENEFLKAGKARKKMTTEQNL